MFGGLEVKKNILFIFFMSCLVNLQAQDNVTFDPLGANQKGLFIEKIDSDIELEKKSVWMHEELINLSMRFSDYKIMYKKEDSNADVYLQTTLRKFDAYKPYCVMLEFNLYDKDRNLLRRQIVNVDMSEKADVRKYKKYTDTSTVFLAAVLKDFVKENLYVEKKNKIKPNPKSVIKKIFQRQEKNELNN